MKWCVGIKGCSSKSPEGLTVGGFVSMKGYAVMKG